MNENDMPIFDPHNPNYTINNYEQNYKYEGETQQIENLNLLILKMIKIVKLIIMIV